MWGRPSPAKGGAETCGEADKTVPRDSKASDCVGHPHSLLGWVNRALECA